MITILYKAGYAWKGRTLSLLYVCFWGFFFFKYPDSLLGYWQEAGWIGRACEITFLLIMPLGLLDAFVTRTIFTNRLVDHRSLFGMKTTGEYATIDKIILSTSFLKICFVDGKKIKIWRAQGDMRKIVSVIQEHAGKNIPVESDIETVRPFC